MINALTLLAITLDHTINMDHLWKSLEIMWKGVVAIFVVIALVIIVTNIVNKICLHFENRKKDDEQE